MPTPTEYATVDEAAQGLLSRLSCYPYTVDHEHIRIAGRGPFADSLEQRLREKAAARTPPVVLRAIHVGLVWPEPAGVRYVVTLLAS